MDPALVPALHDALVVARTGSVAEAARTLHKTPSAVSQQLAHLTDALGVALFERRGRGLTLSPAGQEFLPAAVRLFDEAEGVFALLRRLAGSGATLLRIATSDYLGKALLVPVLRDLAVVGAPLQFEIRTVHSEEALARLERGDVDLGIVSQAGDRPALSSRPLFDQSFYWIMPRRAGKPRPLEERLTHEPVLRLAQGSGGRRLLETFLAERGLRPVSTIDVPSVSLLLAYATAGVGIGLIPALAAQGVARRRVTVEPAAVPSLPVRLVMRAGWRASPAGLDFIDRVVAEATAHGRALRQGGPRRKAP